MKAIETKYLGYRFRSRLEAKWAVFFRSLRISFWYEPEGFELGGLLYLPDFYLKDQQAFIEIKGDSPDAEEQAKARELASASGKRVFVAFGDIPINPMTDAPYADSAWAFVPGADPVLVEEDVGWWWCRCPGCDKFDVQYQGRHARMACECSVKDEDRAQSCEHPLILAAYERARGARFEFGETP